MHSQLARNAAVSPTQIEKRFDVLLRRHLQVVPHLLLRVDSTEGDPGPYLRWPVLT